MTHDNIDCAVQILKNEIESGSEKRVFAEIANLLCKYELADHFQCLAEASTHYDVIESAENYIKAVKELLEREQIRDDMLADYLGVSL